MDISYLSELGTFLVGLAAMLSASAGFKKNLRQEFGDLNPTDFMEENRARCGATPTFATFGAYS